MGATSKKDTIICMMLALMWGAAPVAHAATDVKADTKTDAKPAKAGPASLGEKYDTKLPIEISSDNLEVLQHDSKAIFKGNVVAVQGKIRLTSDVMIVHYKQKSDQAQAGKPSSPASSPSPSPTPAPTTAPGTSSPASSSGAMGAITLIEVEGNVFMATPEESAKGDKGNYQVDEKLLHLTGDNVILTRDKNILRGTELVYNLETGRSVLTNNGAKVGANGGRVRGVFVPNQDTNAKGKGNSKNKPSPSPSPTALTSPKPTPVASPTPSAAPTSTPTPATSPTPSAAPTSTPTPATSPTPPAKP